MLTLLLIGVLAWAFNIQPVKASGTIYIHADGSIEPPTANITSVDNVTYTFTDNNYASIVVERGSITIDGNGYVLQGSGKGRGFYWIGMNNIAVRNTNIRMFDIGVQFVSSSTNTISGNSITDNAVEGIHLMSSSNNTISGNRVALIDIRGGSDNLISGNSIVGRVFLGRSTNNTISGNNITEGLWLEGVGMAECSNCVISGNTIVNGHWGIDLRFYCNNNTISGNKITDNDKGGIRLFRCDNNVISGNKITDNSIDQSGYAVYIVISDGNIVSGNNITNNKDFGVSVDRSSNNTFSGNSITRNKCGVSFEPIDRFYNSSDNRFYHNNFVDNAEQVHFYTPGCINVWNDGYPSGGNYWNDYVGVDLHHGPYQNETGSDGIGDTPYTIDENNQDNYPLMEPWSLIKTVHATIDIDPDTLNLRSMGKWITCYIELPEGYNVSDTDVTSVMLNDTVPVYPKTHAIGDYDEDGIPDLMVKFGRAEVIDYIMANVNMTKLLEEKFMPVTLTTTGKLDDGTQFQGYTKIRIIARAGLPKVSTKISFNLSPNPATIGQTITLTGNLKSQLGNATSNAPVEVYYSIDNGHNWVHAGTIQTDSAGGFSAKGKLTIVGTFLVAVVYHGNFRYSQSYRIETLTINSST